MNKNINVLSLFDGIGTGLKTKRIGVHSNCLSSEIEQGKNISWK